MSFYENQVFEVYDVDRGANRYIKVIGEPLMDKSCQLRVQYQDTGEIRNLKFGEEDIDIDAYKIKEEPFYINVKKFTKEIDGESIEISEEDVFKDSFNNKMPIMLKGPTGCGKTRFVEYMAYKLDLPLFYAAGNEDLSANDLVGRYIIKGDEIKWQDGPLTLAAKYGGIFYLDEIAEVRKDVLSKIHEATDHQRKITLEKKGGTVIHAHENFFFVAAYNPGYQRLKLKPSLQQRFTSIEFEYAKDLDSELANLEMEIISHEGGVSRKTAEMLVELAIFTRKLEDLDEGAGTRTLIRAAQYIGKNYSFKDACELAIKNVITEPTKEYEDVRKAIDRQIEIISKKYGESS